MGGGRRFSSATNPVKDEISKRQSSNTRSSCSVTSAQFTTGVSLLAVISFLCFELGGCIYSKRLDWEYCNSNQNATCANDDCACDWPSTLGECDAFYVGNVSMAIQVVWIFIFKNMLLDRISLVDIFTCNISRHEMLSFALLSPTFISTGFLFARREQTPTEWGDRGGVEYLARVCFNNYQVMLWLFAAMIMGHYHVKVKDTNWYKKLPFERKKIISPGIKEDNESIEIIRTSTRLQKR